MRKIRRSEWGELREAAWEWDPIGLGQEAREFADDEYDCIIEQVVPLLQRDASVAEIVAHFDSFLPEHFGLSPAPRTPAFAEAAMAWWRKVRA